MTTDGTKLGTPEGKEEPEGMILGANDPDGKEFGTPEGKGEPEGANGALGASAVGEEVTE